MHFVYVLRSINKEHWYVGSSSNLSSRLEQHNQGKTRSTKPYRPWQMVYSEEFQTKSEACKREFYLKSPKGYLDYKQIKNKII